LRHRPLSFCLEKEQQGVDEEEYLLRKDIIVCFDVDVLKNIAELHTAELDHISDTDGSTDITVMRTVVSDHTDTKK